MWFGYSIYCKSSTWAYASTGGKRHKFSEFLGSFRGRPLGRHFGTFLAPFLEPFWDHFGIRMAKFGGPKSDGEKVPKKVMRVFAGACDMGGWGSLKTLQH